MCLFSRRSLSPMSITSEADSLTRSWSVQVYWCWEQLKCGCGGAQGMDSHKFADPSNLGRSLLEGNKDHSCGRSEFCQGAKLLAWRKNGSGYLPRRCPHGRRGSGQSTGRSGKKRERHTEKNKARNRERTDDHQPLTMDDHEYGVMRTNTFLSFDQ